MVNTAMTEPARKLKRSAVKNIFRFPAIKANNGKTILVESRLESQYCLHLEFDNSVVEYIPQPKTFNLPSLSEEEVTNKYTPDFFVRYNFDRSAYIEVKPKDESETEHFNDIFSRFETFLNSSSASFHVKNEEFITQQPLLKNYEALFKYRKRPSLNTQNLYQCASKIEGKRKFSEIIKELESSANLREVYTWLALGYLYFDMTSEVFSMNTEVKFNV